MTTKHYYRVLTIAGSDSGGGAGIQADLKTFSALGCYGMSAITALTAQNTVSVNAIQAVPAEFVSKQIDAVVGDIGVDAVKIGMLQTPEIIQTVAERLKVHGLINVVLDPVMVAKSGDNLLREDAIDALRVELLPLAMVITPNIPEAETLLDQSIPGRVEMENAGEELLKTGAKAVLIKGGHIRENLSADCLCLKGEDETVSYHWLEIERIKTHNTHGTGCTLSSAIAAHLAKGLNIREAVVQAKGYITEAIRSGAAYTMGNGHGPVHHFYEWWGNQGD